MMIKDKIRSIEILLNHLAISQVTVQEVKAVHAVIACLAQEARDLNEIPLTLSGRIRDQEKIDINRDRLTKFNQWSGKTTDGLVAWTRKELTRLRIKNGVTPPAELKTSIQGKIRGLQILLEPTTILRATAQKGSISYIQRFNHLIMDASAIRRVLAKLEYIGATEDNSIKTSLKNLKNRSYRIFADLQT